MQNRNEMRTKNSVDDYDWFGTTQPKTIDAQKQDAAQRWTINLNCSTLRTQEVIHFGQRNINI